MTNSTSLDQIADFHGLVHYLRDALEWEIPEEVDFEDITFNWSPSEIGLELNEPIAITQLRPLTADQQWGVFFLNFPQSQLPVTVMRRILRGLSKRKRVSANAADRAAWDKEDLLFISAVGDAGDRRLSFAHFQDRGNDLPTLRVIGWDKDDTVRRLSHTNQVLRSRLAWRHGEGLPLEWRDAFSERPRESVRTAKAMAEALAVLARDIRDRIKLILPREKSNGDLKQLYNAVQQTLSRDLDIPKFADTYAQTIAYGLLSARINQVRERDKQHEESQKTTMGPKPDLPPITADAAGHAMPTTNPFLKELFGSFLSAGGRDAEGSGLDFDELGVGDVVDLLNAADMEAVLLDFDKQKAGDDPVIHFYEGFLHAYDKALKVQRGVFYTPRPVVSFIVRSVDEVLRTEFGLADGLADTTTWDQFIALHPDAKMPEGVKGQEPFVNILDPATGTGTFLVEVIDLIHATMTTKWAQQGLDKAARGNAWNAYVPQHLLPRLHGFELMMAPYAVAHMKLGLKLADTGYRFEGRDADGKPARARLFLTNALEPARNLDMELSFMSEALAHEAKAANEAKAKARFTVVVGNPPYSGVSANLTANLRAIVDPYRYVGSEKIVERGALQFEKNLQDDYIKFYRLAEKYCLASPFSVTSIITNHTYLQSPSLRGLRYSLIDTFSGLHFFDFHGNSKTGERAPDGEVDENVFDIQQGVAVCVLVRSQNVEKVVRRSDIWGSRDSKYHEIRSLTLRGAGITIAPTAPLYAFQAPATEDFATYLSWMALDSLFLNYSTGIATARDGMAVQFDQASARAIQNDFTARTSDELREKYGLGDDTNDWKVDLAAADISSRPKDEDLSTSYYYRPLDRRWTLYTGKARGFLCNPRQPTMRNFGSGVIGLCTVKSIEGGKPYRHVLVTDRITDHHAVALKEVSYVLPLWQQPRDLDDTARPNLSPAFTDRLAALTDLGFDDSSTPPKKGELAGPQLASLAQGELSLRRERGDLTASFGARDVFDWFYAVLHSPTYRERYADFLKSDFARVPLPRDRALLTALIPLGTELVALHLLDPVSAPCLIDPSVHLINPNGVEVRLDGRKTNDRRATSGRVYVNDGCWFETVPEGVWDHWVGGYQPARKWLKDRAQTGSGVKLKPGRVLTAEDQLHYRRMIVALRRTAEVMAEIDRIIALQGGWPDAFKGMTD